MYAEQEAAIKREEAALKEEQKLPLARSERKQEELQASLNLLKEKKLFAEVQVEAGTEIVEHDDRENNTLPLDDEFSVARTKKYVGEIYSKTRINDQENQNTENNLHKDISENKHSKSEPLRHSAPQFVPMSCSSKRVLKVFSTERPVVLQIDTV